VQPDINAVYGKYRREYAHRVAYSRAKGPIPAGFHIDHLCRNRLCVNPDHLEAVDPKTNILRGVGAPAQNALKTHCVRGHEFTPGNTHLSPAGWRICRICQRLSSARRREAASGRPGRWLAQLRFQEIAISRARRELDSLVDRYGAQIPPEVRVEIERGQRALGALLARSRLSESAA
jgi:hypothetical protein